MYETEKMDAEQLRYAMTAKARQATHDLQARMAKARGADPTINTTDSMREAPRRTCAECGSDGEGVLYTSPHSVKELLCSDCRNPGSHADD